MGFFIGKRGVFRWASALGLEIRTWGWEPDLEDRDHDVGKLFSSELVCGGGPSFTGEGAQGAGAPGFSWAC